MNSREFDLCLERATSALISSRNPAGYWEGRLASSPLATAVAVAALADGELSAAKAANAFQYLSRTQNSDGGWGDTEISKSNLAATLLVLSADAMKSGLSPDGRDRARAYSDKAGGLGEGLRRVYGSDLTFQVPIRMSAACAGLIPWREVDALPFELALAPRGLMGALRLPVVSYALPALVSVGLARHCKAPSWMLPFRWLREAIADRALSAILAMQPQSGGYLEAIPITAFCVLGLKAAGREAHPVARNARRFLLDTQREDGSWAVEVNLSVWNTTRAIDALAAAGLLESALSENERVTTRDWLLAQQCTGVSVYSDARPGGWGWNHLSGSVPDVDDTSGAILALRHLGVDDAHPAIVSGREWLIKLQNRNGGWPTFCRGWEKLPFDRSAPDLTAHAIRALGSVSDEPWPIPSGLTNEEKAAHAIREVMCRHQAASAIVRGWQYLRRVQRRDGSLAPLWFGCEQAADELNATYGTTHVLLACSEVQPGGLLSSLSLVRERADWRGRLRQRGEGVPPVADFSGAGDPSPRVRAERRAHVGPLPQGERARACADAALTWLLGVQNSDGGFGGCAGARSTAEETGLALRALAFSGVDPMDDTCVRAVRWLMENQRADGGWNPAPIGFYFAVLWYYEELYPLYYALGGLGAVRCKG